MNFLEEREKNPLRTDPVYAKFHEHIECREVSYEDFGTIRETATQIHQVFTQVPWYNDDEKGYDYLLKNIHVLGLKPDTISAEMLSQKRNVLFKILTSEHLKDVIWVCKELDITDDLSMVDIIHNFATNAKKGLFLKLHFRQCIEHFGKEYLKNVFTNDGYPNTTNDWQSVIQQKISGHRYHPTTQDHGSNVDNNDNEVTKDSYVDNFDLVKWSKNQGEAEKILNFCKGLGFPSGEISPKLKLRFFFTALVKDEEDDEYDFGFHDVLYLGSYSTELNYFIKHLGIPFSVLFGIDSNKLGEYCGTLRSLYQAYMRTKGESLLLDFEYYSNEREAQVQNLFNEKTWDHFAQGSQFGRGNIRKAIDLIKMLQGYNMYITQGLGRWNRIITKLSGYNSSDIDIIGSVLHQIPRKLRNSFLHALTKESDVGEFATHIDEAMDGYLRNSRPFLLNCIKRHGWKHIAENRKLYRKVGFLLGLIPQEYLTDTIERLEGSSIISLDIDTLKTILQGYHQLKFRNPIMNRGECLRDYSLFKEEIEKQKQEQYYLPTKNISLITKLGYLYQDVQGLSKILSDKLLGFDSSIIQNEQTRLMSALNNLHNHYAGLYSIGGKVHYPNSIDQDKISNFRNKYGLDSTTFTTIHANSSVLLPPTYFPEELKMMIGAMHDAGLLVDDPQLQICIPGRLPNQLAGVLGSSMLLATQQHVQYTPESFGTTHLSNTGRRLVVYDAGNYDPYFKFNGSAVGRTDVLLLKDVNLVDAAKVVGSLLGQSVYGGWFERLGEDFVRDYGELLSKYNLDQHLTAPRIFDYETNNSQDPYAEKHFKTVKAFTDQHYNDWLIRNHTHQTQGLLVFEFQKLLQSYWGKITSIQKKYLYS